MIFSPLRKLSPVWSVRLIIATNISGFVWRFFTGTMLGSFFLLVALYGGMWLWSETKPLTPSQLATWLTEIPTDWKISLLTSMLTIVGFLIAFHTAMRSWVRQTESNLKLSVAGEIEQFFAEATQHLVQADIYAQLLIDTVERIRVGGATSETLFKVHYAVERTPPFIAVRERLAAMSVEVHRILGKNYLLLSSIWGGIDQVEFVIKAFTQVTQSMWFRVPYLDKNAPNPLETFLEQVQVAECMRYRTLLAGNFGAINAVTGAIGGQILGSIIGLNLSSTLTLLAKRRLMAEVFREVRQRQRDNHDVR